MQPQRDVGRLHRLPNYPHEVVVQGFEVCLVPELGREGFEGLSSVVLLTVEAPVYETLDSTPQGSKQGRNKECGCHNSEGGLLARESDEHPLQYDDAPEVEGNQRGGQRAVDEGAVYDHVDVEQVRAYTATPMDRGRSR